MRRARYLVALALAGALLALAGGTVRVPPPDGTHAWPLGGERRYALELHTRATLAAGPALLDVELRGELVLALVATAPDIVVRARYAGTTLAVAGTAAGAPATTRAQLAAALATPWYLTYGADGTLRALRAAPGTLPLAVGVMRAIATTARPLAPSRTPRAWEATETDASGAHVAAYAWDAGALRKRKLRYADGETEVVAGAATLAFARGGPLRSAHATDHVRSRRPPLPAIDVETTLALGFAGAADRRDALRAWVAQLAALPDLLRADVALRANTDRAARGDWQLADILATLRAHALAKQAGTPTREAKERAARAYAALTALLRLEPAQLAAVHAHIVDGGPLAATLISALRDAGSPEAQEVLRALLDDARARDRRPRLARALSLVEHPTEATVAALRALQGDAELGAQATYGLGSALHRLREREPARAADILAQLRDQLARAATSARRGLLLTALGNGGHPDALAVIEPYLRDADPYLRATATQALRLIPGAHVDDLLASAARDGDDAVRAAALDAFAARAATPALVAMLAARLTDEPAFPVRSRAVYLAARWIGAARTQLHASLANVAAHDASADLRRIAHDALR